MGIERERKEGGRLTEVEREEDIKRQEEREIVERYIREGEDKEHTGRTHASTTTKAKTAAV